MADQRAADEGRVRAYLVEHGGSVEDATGRGLTGEMARAIGVDPPAVLNALLARMEARGQITRNTRGLRTYRIALAEGATAEGGLAASASPPTEPISAIAGQRRPAGPPTLGSGATAGAPARPAAPPRRVGPSGYAPTPPGPPVPPAAPSSAPAPPAAPDAAAFAAGPPGSFGASQAEVAAPGEPSSAGAPRRSVTVRRLGAQAVSSAPTDSEEGAVTARPGAPSEALAGAAGAAASADEQAGGSPVATVTTAEPPTAPLAVEPQSRSGRRYGLRGAQASAGAPPVEAPAPDVEPPSVVAPWPAPPEREAPPRSRFAGTRPAPAAYHAPAPEAPAAYPETTADRPTGAWGSAVTEADTTSGFSAPPYTSPPADTDILAGTPAPPALPPPPTATPSGGGGLISRFQIEEVSTEPTSSIWAAVLAAVAGLIIIAIITVFVVSGSTSSVRHSPGPDPCKIVTPSDASTAFGADAGISHYVLGACVYDDGHHELIVDVTNQAARKAFDGSRDATAVDVPGVGDGAYYDNGTLRVIKGTNLMLLTIQPFSPDAPSKQLVELATAVTPRLTGPTG